MQPIFSLCYTSRRPHIIKEVVEKWFARATMPEAIEVIVSIDSSDEASKTFMNGDGATLRCKWVVQSEPPWNCVRGWNAAAVHAKGKVLIAISDDFDCPNQWDYKLMTLPQKGWMEREAVIRINDGFVRTICTMPILTKKRYNRLGYLFYPRYESLFCDTDLTEHAIKDGVLIDAPHLIFQHLHCDNQKRARDSTDLEHASSARWNRGEMLFNFRKSVGFPIDDGPQAVDSEINFDAGPVVGLRNNYAVYIQATKDDFCLKEVCIRLLSEGARNFFFCIPDEYWSGKTTPNEHIDEVYAVHRFLNELNNVESRTIIFNVEKYRVSGRSRIEVETYLRNDSLAQIHKAGFNHILIVDGDELWVPGMLKKLDDVVVRYAPQAVACHMIPVVGLPGYPIDQAQDKITIYINAETCTFRNCRSPLGNTHMMEDHGVIHFTATRRTMDEIVRKHMDSGHADDPDYDMEGWCKNVLPYIQPGMKNVHMFKKWQIWPIVRNWRMDEVEHIPDSIKPFLGIRHKPMIRDTIKLKSSAPLDTTINLRRSVTSNSRVCEFSDGNRASIKRHVVKV